MKTKTKTRKAHHRRLLKAISRIRKVEGELRAIRSALGWLTHPAYYKRGAR